MGDDFIVVTIGGALGFNWVEGKDALTENDLVPVSAVLRGSEPAATSSGGVRKKPRSPKCSGYVSVHCLTFS